MGSRILIFETLLDCLKTDLQVNCSVEKMVFLENTVVNVRVNIIGSSRLEVFCKKAVLKNFVKFVGKHLCWNPFFNKVAGYMVSIY